MIQFFCWLFLFLFYIVLSISIKIQDKKQYGKVEVTLVEIFRDLIAASTVLIPLLMLVFAVFFFIEFSCEEICGWVRNKKFTF